MKKLILLLFAATSLMAQSVGGVSVGGGGTGSGTVSDGTATDVPCYTDTNTVGPCSTGSFYFNTALIVPTGVGAGLKIGDGDTGIQEQSDDVLDIITNGSTRFAISVNIADFAVPVSVPDGTAAAPGIRFRSDTNTGLYRVGADSIGFAANGANVATLDSTGLTFGTSGANFLTAEGATADAFETTFAVTDPTADRTWTFPDATDTVVGLATAQTFATGTKTVTSKFDFGGGTLEAPNSTTLPGTCTLGEVYFDSDATAGSNLYGCTATDTWTLLGGGGGSSLVYSCTVGTDASTSNSANTALLTCTIGANTLSVNDFCRAEAQWSFTDDGDTSGTWNAYITLNGTAGGDSMHSAASWGNSEVSAFNTANFSVDSTTVAQIWGAARSEDGAFGMNKQILTTRDIDTTASMNVYAIGGVADTTSDSVTALYLSVQCWTSD